jgi:hypothetical protein
MSLSEALSTSIKRGMVLWQTEKRAEGWIIGE